MTKQIHDPETWLEMSQPHDSLDALDEALEAFDGEVRKLRKKYGLANIYVIVGDSYRAADSEIVETLSYFAAGNAQFALPMVAWAFGREQQVHRRYIDTLATGKQP